MARLLLVDDEPQIRVLTRTMLEKAGHTVEVAEHGEEALSILRERGADLVILDIAMPEMSGWEVCRIIKSDPALRHIPVLMFTVMTRDEDVNRSFESGADAHLKKPFTMRELLEAVENLLAHAQGTRE